MGASGTDHSRNYGPPLYGNRPLHTNGKFPDGTDTKVLWTFARPITRFKATAIDLSSTASAMTLWDRRNEGGGRSLAIGHRPSFRRLLED